MDCGLVLIQEQPIRGFHPRMGCFRGLNARPSGVFGRAGRLFFKNYGPKSINY